MNYDIGMGRMNHDDTGWFDCFFHVDFGGYLPFYIYSSFGGIDCWQSRTTETDVFRAALQFCQRKNINLGSEVRYIYQANGGGWAIWRYNEGAPEDWELVACYDAIGAQERLRGA